MFIFIKSLLGINKCKTKNDLLTLLTIAAAMI